MKKKKTKVEANDSSTETSNPIVVDSKTDDEIGKTGLSLPIHKSKLLISEKELKEELKKI